MLPSYQFYPGDWLRDVALRACTLAARGLWIDMNCLMHQGQPYGHLTLSTKDQTKDILRPILPVLLARMVGSSEVEVTELLSELEGAGVFSRTDEGVIFSRRMIRDDKVRQSRAIGGYQSLKNPNVPRPKRTKQSQRISLDPPSADPSSLSLEGSPSSSSSSSSSKQEEAMNASVAGRVLAEKLGIFNIHFQEQLSRQLGIETARTGESFEEAIDRMSAQWQLYNDSRSKLNYPVSSALKFFDSGTWQDQTLWPWKDGTKPKAINSERYFKGGGSDV